MFALFCIFVPDEYAFLCLPFPRVGRGAGEPLSDMRAFAIDTAPPTTRLTAVPALVSDATDDVLFAFSAEDAGSAVQGFDCRYGNAMRPAQRTRTSGKPSQRMHCVKSQ